MRTLLTGAVVVTCDGHHTVYDPGDVVMEDSLIVYVGPAYTGPYDVRLFAGGRLLMPGLINAHTHSGMSIFRSLSDDVDLMVFLQDRVWPREVLLTDEDVYAASLLSAVEMARSGVTTYVDMYFHEEALARVADDVGLRALITPTMLDIPVWTPILGSLDRQVERGLHFSDRWEGCSGRVHTGLGPHAPYTVPVEALGEIAREARGRGLPVNIHLVETEGEVQRYGLGERTIIEALHAVSFFDGPVIAAHSVWVGSGDLDIYAAHHVGVAHCPGSNAKLAAGIAPVVAMLDQGIPVGLGTDGPATNNSLDVWGEMRLAPLLAKVTAGDPTTLPASEALWMATRLGAQAIHLPEVGILAPGYRADILMLDLRDPGAIPIFDQSTYLAHLVYSIGSRSVDSVWVHGAPVVRGGEVVTVDEAAVRRAAQGTALDVAARAAR